MDGDIPVGHVTRCIHSPRLKRNIGFANVPVENSQIGNQLKIDSPNGILNATVCENSWFPAEIKISLD